MWPPPAGGRDTRAPFGVDVVDVSGSLQDPVPERRLVDRAPPRRGASRRSGTSTPPGELDPLGGTGVGHGRLRDAHGVVVVDVEERGHDAEPVGVERRDRALAADPGEEASVGSGRRRPAPSPEMPSAAIGLTVAHACQPGQGEVDDLAARRRRRRGRRSRCRRHRAQCVGGRAGAPRDRSRPTEGLLAPGIVLSFRGSSRSDDAVAERLTIADGPWGTARIRRASMQRARRPRRPARTARRRARWRSARPDARAGRDPPRRGIPVPRSQPGRHGRRARPARRGRARRRDRAHARERGRRRRHVRMGGRAGSGGTLRRRDRHRGAPAPGGARRDAGPPRARRSCAAGSGSVPPSSRWSTTAPISTAP